MTTPEPEPAPLPRARWGRRAIFGVLIAVNLIAFVSWLAIRNISNKLETALPRDEDVVAELDRVTGSEEPKTFLLIGSDSRANVEGLGGAFGKFAGQRADVIMLVKVYPKEGRAQILSLPRDLRVEIDGHGTNRVNAAYTFGGAPLIVKTIREELGIPIHHYAEVDFLGFARIVDELGGVHLAFPHAARDAKSGLAVEAGTTELDGAMALAYARSRGYQEYRDGSWRTVDGSDIGRTHRQQQLVFAILSEMKKPSTLLEAGSLIEAVGQHLTIDARLTDDVLISLAWSMRGLDASDVEAATLPTKGVSGGGRAYQVPEEPEASAVLHAFLTGSSLVAATEGPIRLQVLNGNGSAGAAGLWAGTLEAKGFEIVNVADADSFDFSHTVVLARADQLGRLQGVAEVLGVEKPSAGAIPSGIDGIVIIGHDLITQAG